MTRFVPCLLAFLLGGVLLPQAAPGGAPQAKEQATMQLGNFSVSLTVKDLAKSRAFYEKLGLKKVGGDGKGYVILQNETATVGLYQGMFERNMLTFNPGWDRNCATLPDFDDVRELQKRLKERGVALDTAADEASTGPASFVVTDPDGNPILVDQHVPRPKR